jgi:hypothetical protein
MISTLIYLHVIHESRVLCTHHKAPVNQYAHAHWATRFRNKITLSVKAERLKTLIRTRKTGTKELCGQGNPGME